jgi:hypothetical protein
MGDVTQFNKPRDPFDRIPIVTLPEWQKKIHVAIEALLEQGCQGMVPYGDAIRAATDAVSEMAQDLADYETSFKAFDKASSALMHAYAKAHPDVARDVWTDATKVNVWAAAQIAALGEQRDAIQAHAHDCAAKIQYLVDWADGRGLLEEHVFTFPDGDTWEAKR